VCTRRARTGSCTKVVVKVTVEDGRVFYYLFFFFSILRPTDQNLLKTIFDPNYFYKYLSGPHYCLLPITDRPRRRRRHIDEVTACDDCRSLIRRRLNGRNVGICGCALQPASCSLTEIYSLEHRHRKMVCPVDMKIVFFFRKRLHDVIYIL
jgi:hypothetical protein